MVGGTVARRPSQNGNCSHLAHGRTPPSRQPLFYSLGYTIVQRTREGSVASKSWAREIIGALHITTFFPPWAGIWRQVYVTSTYQDCPGGSTGQPPIECAAVVTGDGLRNSAKTCMGDSSRRRTGDKLRGFVCYSLSEVLVHITETAAVRCAKMHAFSSCTCIHPLRSRSC
jgi:hypothetical protein